MTALWVHELAERFWTDAGGAPQAFPRNLGDAIAWALPVAHYELPDLCVASVDAWLAERGIEARLAMPNRPLRACMIVSQGIGCLFLDANDSVEERRFSLAHEVAHYLVEYDAPRDAACERLGDGIVGVLDGRRLPTERERIGALLGGVSLALRLHLMERTPDGHVLGGDVSAAERRADDLAIELLAPFDDVRADLPERATLTVVETVLRRRYGLPRTMAAAYAKRLAPAPPAGSLFRQLFSAL